MCHRALPYVVSSDICVCAGDCSACSACNSAIAIAPEAAEIPRPVDLTANAVKCSNLTIRTRPGLTKYAVLAVRVIVAYIGSACVAPTRVTIDSVPCLAHVAASVIVSILVSRALGAVSIFFTPSTDRAYLARPLAVKITPVFSCSWARFASICPRITDKTPRTRICKAMQSLQSVKR